MTTEHRILILKKPWEHSGTLIRVIHKGRAAQGVLQMRKGEPVTYADISIDLCDWKRGMDWSEWTAWDVAEEE